jgi:hypothetical protein
MCQNGVEYKHGYSCGALGYSGVNHLGIHEDDYSTEQQALFRSGFLDGKATRVIRKPFCLPTMHRRLCQ